MEQYELYWYTELYELYWYREQYELVHDTVLNKNTVDVHHQAFEFCSVDVKWLKKRAKTWEKKLYAD